MKNYQRKDALLRLAIIAALLFVFAQMTATAQTAAFNFQGRLNDGTSPANGRYDLEFRLYDGLTGDNQVGAAISKPNLMLVNGVFSTQLDFGATAFNGADRFIEIRLRATGSNNGFVVLVRASRFCPCLIRFEARGRRSPTKLRKRKTQTTHTINSSSAAWRRQITCRRTATVRN